LNPLGVLQSTVLQTSNQTVSTGGRLPYDWAAAILLFFVAVFAIHFVRRAYRQPPRSGGTHVDVPGDKVKVFDIVDRLFHWSLFLTLGLVVLSGLSIYSPGTLVPVLTAFGVTGANASATLFALNLHTDMLWLILGLVIIHICWDLAVNRTGRDILPTKADISDTMTRTAGFMGFGPKTQPRHGKFDVFMKISHWGMVLCFTALGITGIYLWNPYGLMPAMGPGFENSLRLFHDIFAFLFIGLIIGHVYFAVLPINWPVLRSMTTGSISGDAYNHDYDSSRWPLKTEKAAPSAPAPMASTPTPPAPAAAPAKAVQAEKRGE
jgi:formate dehydrogenase subunit gamma